MVLALKIGGATELTESQLSLAFMPIAVSWKLVAGLRIEESMPNIKPDFVTPLPGEVILGLDGKSFSSPDDLAVLIGSGIEGRLPAAA